MARALRQGFSSGAWAHDGEPADAAAQPFTSARQVYVLIGLLVPTVFVLVFACYVANCSAGATPHRRWARLGRRLRGVAPDDGLPPERERAPAKPPAPIFVVVMPDASCQLADCNGGAPTPLAREPPAFVGRAFTPPPLLTAQRMRWSTSEEAEAEAPGLEVHDLESSSDEDESQDVECGGGDDDRAAPVAASHPGPGRAP
jgi:hypothetical protein